MKIKNISKMALTAACLAQLTAAYAAIVNLPTIDRGTIQDNGTHFYSSVNYAAGSDMTGRVFRSFYLFDLSALSGNIVTGATLKILLPSDGYTSPDSSEHYTLYDVLPGSLPILEGDVGSIVNTSIFDDLGSGNIYAGTEVLESAAGSFIELSLDAQALSDMNSAIGSKFAIGGAVTSLSQPASTQEVIFVNTQFTPLSDTFLTLEITPIPLPATAWLFGSGLLGLIGIARRKKS